MIERIGESVLHLPGIIGGPTILLGDTVTIVDAGVPGSEDAILDAVTEAGRAPDDVADIVITHADGDHVGSLVALVARTGATVWAGEHEADVIEGKAASRGGDVTRVGTVDRRFRPGDTLPLHGGIEVVETHGHTRGHVSLFLPRNKTLIAGDALNNLDGLGGSPPARTADTAQAQEALRTLAALRPDAIIFGHGRSLIGGAAEALEEFVSRSDGN